MFQKVTGFINGLFSAMFSGIRGILGMKRDVTESVKVERASKRLRCFFILGESIQEYRGRLSTNTNTVIIDVLDRSWIRDKIYNPSQSTPIVICHDAYPRTVDLSIFELSKEDKDKFVADPQLFYKLVDRDFTLDSYMIGKAKFLESLIPTPRRQLIMMVAIAFLAGIVLGYYVIFYMLMTG